VDFNFARLNNCFRFLRVSCFLGFLVLAHCANAQSGKQVHDWPTYGGDPGGLKYSALDQINKTNVDKLQIAWKWLACEKPNPEKGIKVSEFEAVPLKMSDDVLYLPTAYNRVIALDANSGRQIWSYDPHSYEDAGPFTFTPGLRHRGVVAWTNGKERRIFINTRWRLVAVDATTGEPISTFGRDGEVDMAEAIGWKGSKYDRDNTSPGVVYKDIVIFGNRVPDHSEYHNPPPGDILAFDVRSGKLVWRFRTIPIEGEKGHETWQGDGWQWLSHANVWPPFVLDEKRGLVYMGVTTPGNDFSGVDRKGADLFGDSLVCLDANTGKLVWYFQTVHHALFDYDGVMTPNLVTIHKDGRSIDVVAAVSKQGFTYVFDRVTGKPIWPIEERPVPQTDMPGEETSPTQPFPTKPLPFAKQGFTADDVVDFTPDLKARALAKVKPYRMGPLFTSPAEQGTLMMPSSGGGANWGGASVDPETGILYVRATNEPTLTQFEISKQAGETIKVGRSSRLTVDGIPINKPPYGTMTAINLNTGDHVWQRPIGDLPEVRNNPLLKGVKLPAELGAMGNSGSLVTRGGLVVVAPGDTFLYFLDKESGKTLWKADLGMRIQGTPMTYETRQGRQYIVVAAGGGTDATLVALSLSQNTPARPQH
jgi:quinoprotein glucose dehydrogenase